MTTPTPDIAAPAMSDRVASNTVIGLIEVIITSVISIFYVRLLLQELGKVDYGIFTALGASGLLSVIVVGGFNTAALRYLALAAGADADADADEKAEQRSTMASTVVLYLGITVALFVTAVIARDFILQTLTIPDDRAGAASTVYWSVVGQFCFAAATAPFAAVRQAHQRFGLLSVADIGQRLVVLAFLIALSLRPSISDDALQGVAIVALIGAALRFALIVGQSAISLPASRFRLSEAEGGQIRAIARFAEVVDSQLGIGSGPKPVRGPTDQCGVRPDRQWRLRDRAQHQPDDPAFLAGVQQIAPAGDDLALRR